MAQCIKVIFSSSLSTSSWQTFGNVKAVVLLLAVQVVSVIKDDDAKSYTPGPRTCCRESASKFVGNNI
jgi:hypothetical protein